MSDLTKMLEDLHVAVAEELLARVRTGEATAAELTVAARFLKDNGIDADMKQDSPLVNLAKVLPFQDPDAPVRSKESA